MLWHIVKFRYAPSTPAPDRLELEQSLRALADEIGAVRLLRLAPSVDEPDVVGLVTALDDEAALEAYRHHPAHLPVLERARELCEDIVRLDVVTADDTPGLPLTEPLPT